MNGEINELKIKIDNTKEKGTHDMENQRKKNETGTQNTMEGHSCRLEQWKKESQNLKIKWKLKTEELLVKQLKSCEKNMQEFTDSIKTPKLSI
jgi:hypothetical protein